MRESCKSGSVGEAAGDRRLYPTARYPRRLAGVDPKATFVVFQISMSAVAQGLRAWDEYERSPQ
jgi:hypothetical protein